MTIDIETKCPECKKETVINVSYDGYLNWKRGMPILNALPEIDIVHREMLMTGICGTCWNEMVKQWDGDEEDKA